jgi:hypothetical protein
MRRTKKHSTRHRRKHYKYNRTKRGAGKNTPQDVSDLFPKNNNAIAFKAAAIIPLGQSVKFPDPEIDIFEEASENLERAKMSGEERAMKRLELEEELADYAKREEMEPFNCSGPECSMMGGRTRKYRKRSLRKKRSSRRK